MYSALVGYTYVRGFYLCVNQQKRVFLVEHKRNVYFCLRVQCSRASSLNQAAPYTVTVAIFVLIIALSLLQCKV